MSLLLFISCIAEANESAWTDRTEIRNMPGMMPPGSILEEFLPREEADLSWGVVDQPEFDFYEIAFSDMPENSALEDASPEPSSMNAEDAGGADEENLESEASLAAMTPSDDVEARSANPDQDGDFSGGGCDSGAVSGFSMLSAGSCLLFVRKRKV